jgi:hypothetical protein
MRLTTKEEEAIKSWTDNISHQYRYIKAILRGDYEGSLKSIYEPQAKLLVELFTKYPDNTNNQTLYRGDVIEEEYQKYLDDNPIGKCITLENTILSFTLSKDIAIKSYENSDKNKDSSTPTILYIINKRESVFLDISTYSKLPHEKEVLCNQGVRFVVTKIEEKENNHLFYYLDECMYLKGEQ